LNDLLIDGPVIMPNNRGAAPDPPSVAAWHGDVGHFERYDYPPGRAGRDRTHVHAEVQVCLSTTFPGRYRSGRYSTEVPVGAVSVVDAWEPHGAEDPCDRAVTATYHMLYVPQPQWDHAADQLGVHPRVGLLVRRRADLAAALGTLSRRSEAHASALEQEEQWSVFIALLFSDARRSGGHRQHRQQPRTACLDRARDYIQAHALRGVTLSEAAREAGLSRQHFAACFRSRYGMPAHRFQTMMRLDHARRLLASGLPLVDVATACGMSDQSHLTRHFKRYLGMTPGRYRAR
jgi:AraC-like DNA-binding protein